MTFNTGKNLLFASLFGIVFWAMILAGGTELTVGAAIADISVDDYAAALKSYLDDKGMVDYKGLKSNRKPLDDFISSLSSLDPKIYEGWNDKEKIAFWINAYNALTLKAIIDHYPIEASLLKSLVYPKNSIRQIPGVWDKLTFAVMGRDMTLDGIEHETLRAKFNEPRIHMALVCAAMGCPPLRNEPYITAKLDAQLDDQAAKFLRDPEKFRIDRSNDKVYLSSIFDWFGQDFVKTYGTDKEFKGFSEKERAVLSFVSSYLESADKAYLLKGGFSIEYLKYDWSLNEKKTQSTRISLSLGL
ncbi:MAG: DUF547 domain-containing protein [Desulfomonile tiedjei]|uniref:DUF547 domain-containing protein n=1 Tax=Desulfomonile tiedjei TaxID=2358 RepID=A0A9D6V118_9BACT|nr:DUF547 domain-containing protein [Desulfomonile tiedjei]